MNSATNYALGIPTSFIYVIIGISIVGAGFYFYKKSKTKS